MTNLRTTFLLVSVTNLIVNRPSSILGECQNMRSSVFLLSLVSLMISSSSAIQAESLPGSTPARANIFTPKKLKIALIGDSGRKEGFGKVLDLIKREGAEMTVHLGDLAYDERNPDAPQMFEDQINSVFGPSYPYLFLVGNHDVGHWFQQKPIGYSEILKRRIQNAPDLHCEGEPGVKASCTYKGLFFVISGVGTFDVRHEEHIVQALSHAKDHVWRICSWHKNQHDMQAGRKASEVGWEAYKLCQRAGAMIITGHEHSYARTKNLRHIGHRSRDHGAFGDPASLVLGLGKTFNVVTGLGGKSLRTFNCRHEKRAWWATVFTDNFLMQNGAIVHNECRDDAPPRALSAKPGGPTHYNFGALFIEFHVDGDQRMAKAEFKTIDGLVIDRFSIFSEL